MDHTGHDPISTSAGRGTVIYDGMCAFCVSRIEKIKAMDTEHALDYMPRQEPVVEERFPQIKNIELDEGVLFIAKDGRVAVAMDAMYEIGKVLPRTRAYTWLYKLPIVKQLARAGYRIVAINRRRLGQTCTDNICERPLNESD